MQALQKLKTYFHIPPTINVIRWIRFIFGSEMETNSLCWYIAKAKRRHCLFVMMKPNAMRILICLKAFWSMRLSLIIFVPFLPHFFDLRIKEEKKLLTNWIKEHWMEMWRTTFIEIVPLSRKEQKKRIGNHRKKTPKKIS